METILKAKIFTGKKDFRIAIDDDNFLIVEATEQPEKGKANKEILKRLKKIFKAEVEIVSGLKSKEKVIKINLPERQVIDLVTQTNSTKP